MTYFTIVLFFKFYYRTKIKFKFLIRFRFKYLLENSKNSQNQAVRLNFMGSGMKVFYRNPGMNRGNSQIDTLTCPCFILTQARLHWDHWATEILTQSSNLLFTKICSNCHQRQLEDQLQFMKYHPKGKVMCCVCWGCCFWCAYRPRQCAKEQ